MRMMNVVNVVKSIKKIKRSPIQKGSDNELIAKQVLESEGFRVFRPEYRAFAKDKDIFNLFDLLAVHKTLRPKFVQVKSNKIKTKTRLDIRDFIREYNLRDFDIEIWAVSEDGTIDRSSHLHSSNPE